MSDQNPNTGNHSLSPSEIIAQGRAALEETLKRQAIERAIRDRREAVEITINAELKDVCSRWNDFSNRYKPGTEPRPGLDAFETEFTELLTRIGTGLQSLDPKENDWRNRWSLVDHEVSFAFWFEAFQRQTPGALPREQHQAAYQYAVYILESVLCGDLLRSAISPALGDLAVRGAVTYLLDLLLGLWGVAPFHMQSPMSGEGEDRSGEAQEAVTGADNTQSEDESGDELRVGRSQTKGGIPPRRLGRYKLGEGPNVKPEHVALRNVYDLIRAARKAGQGPAALMAHFERDTTFKQRVKEAKKRFNESLFRAALGWIDTNPVQ